MTEDTEWSEQSVTQGDLYYTTYSVMSAMFMSTFLVLISLSELSGSALMLVASVVSLSIGTACKYDGSNKRLWKRVMSYV